MRSRCAQLAGSSACEHLHGKSRGDSSQGILNEHVVLTRWNHDFGVADIDAPGVLGAQHAHHLVGSVTPNLESRIGVVVSDDFPTQQ